MGAQRGDFGWWAQGHAPFTQVPPDFLLLLSLPSVYNWLTNTTPGGWGKAGHMSLLPSPDLQVVWAPCGGPGAVWPLLRLGLN